MTTTARLLGLDVIRAAAVCAVLIDHIIIPWPLGSETEATLAAIGLTGVNAFFALSGYLVGPMAIEAARTGLIWNFLARRWLRTIPPAIVVLLMVIPDVTVGEFLGFATFTIFLPAAQPSGTPLPHYWSLAVEEWSYLFLPLLFLVLPRRGLAFSILALWAVLAAFQHAAMANGIGGDKPLYVTWLRLDSVLPGVAVHLLRDRLSAFTWRVVAWGAVVALILAFVALSDQVLLGALGPALFALMLPAAAAWRPGRPQAWFWGAARYTARISYSLYLAHLPLFFIVRAAGVPPGPLSLVLDMVLAFVVAHVLYEGIEKPCMALREKWGLGVRGGRQILG